MKNRLTTLLEEYRRRSETKADQSMWRFVAEKDPYVFSHHPASPAFREHVWRWGGLYFCKGCVVTFGGFLFGAVFFAITGWLRWFNEVEVGLIFALMLVPSLLVYIFQLPRIFRHLSRFLLGVLMVSAFVMLFVTDSWLVRVVIAAAYFAAKTPMERMRNRENRKTESQCRCERSGSGEVTGR